MPVGDVNSTERGSGARYNDGKVKMEYIPMRTLRAVLFDDLDSQAFEAASAILRFEETRDARSLAEALDITGFKDVCDVFHYGAQKYAPWNWAKGMAWSIPMACIKRHLLAIGSGEEIDPESGLPHIGHVGCNVVMLLHFLTHYPEGDDLPPRECFVFAKNHPVLTVVDEETPEADIDWEEHGWAEHDYQPMTAERAAELREQTNARYA